MTQHDKILTMRSLPLMAALMMLATGASSASAQTRGGWGTDTNGHDRYIYKPEPWKPVESNDSSDSSPSAYDSTLERQRQREAEDAAEAAREAERQEAREKARAEAAAEAAREAERQAVIEAERVRVLEERRQAAIAKYASIGAFNVLARVSLRVGSVTLYGYIDTDYQEVLAPQFTSATDFDGDSANVVKDGKSYRIDRYGSRLMRISDVFASKPHRVRSVSKLSAAERAIVLAL